MKIHKHEYEQNWSTSNLIGTSVCVFVSVSCVPVHSHTFNISFKHKTTLYSRLHLITETLQQTLQGIRVELEFVIRTKLL